MPTCFPFTILFAQHIRYCTFSELACGSRSRGMKSMTAVMYFNCWVNTLVCVAATDSHCVVLQRVHGGGFYRSSDGSDCFESSEQNFGFHSLSFRFYLECINLLRCRPADSYDHGASRSGSRSSSQEVLERLPLPSRTSVAYVSSLRFSFFWEQVRASRIEYEPSLMNFLRLN